MKPEAAKRQIRAIKGVRDILPPESALWNRVEQTARDVFATYGYGEIRLPIFEETELFARSVGSETDIVSKEMYSFFDPDRDLEDLVEGYISSVRGKGSSPNILEQYVGAGFALLQWFSTRDPDTLTGKPRELALALREKASRQFSETTLDEIPEIISAFQKPMLQYHREFRNAISVAVSLRPEATASVCRAYIEHGMHTLPGDVKLYYIGPMFRRERPQKGRYRQFYQIGAEVLGQSDAPAIDAEVIEMLMAFFHRVGLTGCKLHLNSIGCRDCRPNYVEKLREALLKVKGQLGSDSQRRIETNPLRVLDSKLPEEQPIIEKLPRIGEHLCPACREHFAALQEQLKLRSIAYEINWRLVRGLDYYMRTTFEIIAPGLGAQNAVCGGGRYDGLVELLGGPATKGIGFAIGTDRVVLSLFTPDEDFWLPPRPQPPAQVVKPFTDDDVLPAAPVLDVLIAWMGAAAYPTAVKLARRLRGEGLSVELPAEEMKLKKSLGLADKLGARYAIIIGENEVASGRFTVKRLVDAQQRELGEAELIEFLRSKP